MGRVSFPHWREGGEYWSEAVVNNVVIGEVGHIEDGTPCFWPSTRLSGALPIYILKEIVNYLEEQNK